MDFTLTADQIALQTMAANFARDKLADRASYFDETSSFPVEILKEAAALGMAGMYVKSDLGGSELSHLEAALIVEQLATACVTTAAYLSIHNMVVYIVDRYAYEDLRQQYGPKLSSMESFASYCLTEPDAGSDAASLKTMAEKKGAYYLVNGAKSFISGGSVSDVYLCMVRTGEASYQGISCLLIEKGTPGLTFGSLEKKMGWKAQPTSMVYFENCRVPCHQLVGKEGEGFHIALNALNGGRINIAACSLGGALAAIRRVRLYLNERKQFGKPLKMMQALRFYFSDMLTDYESARLMVYKAACALDSQLPDAAYWCAMAKRYATDAAFHVADKAMQLLGGYGYLQEYQIERIFRDLRAHQILEGTNEIMREIIAKITLDKGELWI